MPSEKKPQIENKSNLTEIAGSKMVTGSSLELQTDAELDSDRDDLFKRVIELFSSYNLKVMAVIQWVIKNEKGKIIGPYTTDAVLKMIAQGVFTGSEMIARYPGGGTWTQISREPEFYDKLLEVLSDDQKEEAESQPVKSEETVIMALPPTPVKPQSQSASVAPSAINTEPIRSQANTAPVIELSNLKDIKLKSLLTQVRKPLIVLVTVMLLAVIYFQFFLNDVQVEKIHLLMPQKGSAESLGKEEVVKRLQEIVSGFEKDTFENYISAQNKLVGLVEAAPNNTEVRGLLCLVYKELWPFAYQDSQDIKALSFIAQSTKALNPVGLDGYTCEAVRLMAIGRYKEARGVIETALEVRQFQMAPVLYELKGELVAGEKDFVTAQAYVEKAAQLWPQWIKPYLMRAQMLAKSKKFTEAAQLYRQILTAVPQHKVSKIELGIMEQREFKQYDAAFEHLQSALNSGSRVTKYLEANAYLSLAEIYLSKNDKKNALLYAKRSYSLNSTNADSKQIIMNIGGLEGLRDTKVQDSELVYLGDQYARAGDCFAAQAEYKAAFEADNTNGIAAMKAAKCLWQLSQSQEAIEYLDKAIKADPKLIGAYVLQADYYSQRFNYVASARILGRAKSVAPNSYEVMRGYAQIELRRNNMSGAVTYALKALKIYDTDIETYIILAKANAGQREFKEAFRYAVKAIEIDGTNSDAQVVYAKVLSQFQGTESGIYYLQDLINKYQFVTDYRLALAQMYADDERFKSAQEIYQQVIDIDPKNKQAYLGLGTSLQGQGSMEAALKSYLSAAALDPSDAEALFKAGLLYLETQRFPQAIQQFERVLRINNLYPRAHYHIGRAAYLKGDFQKALDESMQERKLNPNLAESYLLAAESYSASKQYTKCAGEYQLALKLRPQGAEIYVKLARCYRLSGGLDVATAMLNMAAQKESGFADIYREQAMLYEMQGEKRSALEAYDKYLALSPNAVDKKEIQAKISQLERGQ